MPPIGRLWLCPWGAPRPLQEIKSIFEVRLGDNSPRGTSGQGRGHLTGNMQRGQCWLEYLVQSQG